jgi:hypothetical protein
VRKSAKSFLLFFAARTRIRVIEKLSGISSGGSTQDREQLLKVFGIRRYKRIRPQATRCRFRVSQKVAIFGFQFLASGHF